MSRLATRLLAVLVPAAPAAARRRPRRDGDRRRRRRRREGHQHRRRPSPTGRPRRGRSSSTPRPRPRPTSSAPPSTTRVKRLTRDRAVPRPGRARRALGRVPHLHARRALRPRGRSSGRASAAELVPTGVDVELSVDRPPPTVPHRARTLRPGGRHGDRVGAHAPASARRAGSRSAPAPAAPGHPAGGRLGQPRRLRRRRLPRRRERDSIGREPEGPPRLTLPPTTGSGRTRAPSSTRRLAALLAPVALQFPTAAARRDGGDRGRRPGDARAWTDSPRSIQFVPAPEEASVDIIRTAAALGQRRLSVTVALPRPRGPGASRDAGAGAGRPVAPSTSPPSVGRRDGRPSRCERRVATPSDVGDSALAYDGAADTVALSVPARALGAPRWVRLGVKATATPSRRATDPGDRARVLADDGHRGGRQGLNSVGKGPRIRRG